VSGQWKSLVNQAYQLLDNKNFPFLLIGGLDTIDAIGYTLRQNAALKIGYFHD
jgi:hypothetical protein